MEEQVKKREDTPEQLLKRLDKMEKRIKTERFWQTTRTTNTVNYWVFDYPPELELMVRKRIQYLQDKNQNGADDFQLVVIDLYELIIEHLEYYGYINQSESFEENSGLDFLIEAVKETLQLTNSDNLMTHYIETRIPDSDEVLVFLTGLGKCFPLLQGPEVFNQILFNMSDRCNRVPIVVFYPGTYTGQELILFNELLEDYYYRAYPIAR